MTKENNKVDINKHEIDIDTLKKQNVNDLLSIKELYKRIEELSEKTSQIKYIDNTLVKKLKKEYENFKKIILDENIQIELSNDIKSIKTKTNEIDTQLTDNTAKMSNILTFKTFPTAEEITNMPVNTTFEVKGYTSNGDIEKCMYKKTGWSTNSLYINNNYVQPITNCMGSEIYLPFFGIREGENYAEQNSRIIENIKNKSFGSTFILPSGHYYFKNPIDLSKTQSSLKGQSMSFTSDINITSQTWLHFNNLTEGQSAIILAGGFIRDINIWGNKNSYSYAIDRSKTFTDNENVEKEVSTIKSYGIKGSGTSILENVYVFGFYYGCYMETANIYINNFFARSCHYGLSIGNDTKVKGVYGWHTHTLLQIRGSISSAIQVRGDSCHHLVEIVGYVSGVYLADLDADYCLGCILKIGIHGSWGSTKNLIVNGIRGRCSVLNSFDNTKGNSPTSDDILSDENLYNWGVICVCKYNSLIGANITMNTALVTNPIDGVSNYRTPEILIVSGNSSVTKGVNISMPLDCDLETEIDSAKLKSYIKTFCQSSGNNTNICITTSKGVYYYNKNNAANITTSKLVTETLA